MKWVALVGAMMIIAGCNVDRRNIAKLDALYMRYPLEGAKLSNELNPCFNGRVKTDTVVRTGRADTTVKRDTIIVAGSTGQTVTKVVTKTVTVKVPILTTITDTVEDFRHIALLNDQLKQGRDSTVIYKTQLADKVKTNHIFLWILIGLGVLIVAYVAIRIF